MLLDVGVPVEVTVVFQFTKKIQHYGGFLFSVTSFRVNKISGTYQSGDSTLGSYKDDLRKPFTNWDFFSKNLVIHQFNSPGHQNFQYTKKCNLGFTRQYFGLLGLQLEW